MDRKTANRDPSVVGAPNRRRAKPAFKGGDLGATRAIGRHTTTGAGYCFVNCAAGALRLAPRRTVSEALRQLRQTGVG
jgi:hypothetical protein